VICGDLGKEFQINSENKEQQGKGFGDKLIFILLNKFTDINIFNYFYSIKHNRNITNNK